MYNDDVILLKWPYLLESNKKGKKKTQIKRDYKIIIEMNKRCENGHPLYQELFVKYDGKYLKNHKLKIAKDFFIKDQEYIKKIREHHKKTISLNFMS